MYIMSIDRRERRRGKMYKLEKEDVVCGEEENETIVAHAFVSDRSSLLVAVVLSNG